MVRQCFRSLNLRFAFALLVAFSCMFTHAAGTSSFLSQRSRVSDPVEPGKWHASFSKCKEYAESNGIPLIAVWSNGDASAPCVKFQSTCQTTTFKNWMATSECVFYFTIPSDGGDGLVGSRVYEWIRGDSTAFPFVRVWWREKHKDQTTVNVALDRSVLLSSAEDIINHLTNGVLRKYKSDPLAIYEDSVDGCYTNGQGIVLYCRQDVARIHYTTNGTMPTGESPVYETPIRFVPPSMDIKAFAVTSEGGTGEVYALACQLPMATVEMMVRDLDGADEQTDSGFLPVVGDCRVPEGNAAEVRMRSSVGGEIHYTLDGSEPTLSSPIYTEPIYCREGDVRVSARGFGDGLNCRDGNVSTCGIRRCVKTPEVVIERIGEGVLRPSKISASCETDGAEIVVGYEERAGEESPYDGPIIVDHPQELYFYARKDNLADSEAVRVSACDYWPSSYEDSFGVAWLFAWTESGWSIVGVEAGEDGANAEVEFPSAIYGRKVNEIAEFALNDLHDHGVSELMFDGAPPMGLPNSGIDESMRIAYRPEYRDEWMAMNVEWGFPNLYECKIQEPQPQIVAVTNFVYMTVTNVVIHYVLQSEQPQFVQPATSDTGFVNVITEVRGGCVAVPASWAAGYQGFTEKFGDDFTHALGKLTGKRDSSGKPMFVWQDYVAGTNPTDVNDVFKASIAVINGKVQISYTPELDEERKRLRTYTVWGKRSLMDASWEKVENEKESAYNFFKVTVEMKDSAESVGDSENGEMP